MNLSEELVGDGGFDEEEENQIQIYWRAGNTMVSIDYDWGSDIALCKSCNGEVPMINFQFLRKNLTFTF